MIRKATENDILAIAEIYEDIHDEEEAGNLTTGWIRGVYPTSETAAYAIGKGEMYVMEDGGRIVAAAKINHEEDPSYADGNWEFDAPKDQILVIHTLVVSPSAMSRSCGKQFIAFYEQLAIEMNCKYLRMDTNEKNLRARKFYSKIGYKEIGIVPCQFNGIEAVNLVLLEKKL